MSWSYPARGLPRPTPFSCLPLWSLGALLLSGAIARPQAADLREAQRDFLAGRYAECIATAETGVEHGPQPHDWHLLLTESLFTLGRYGEAYTALTNALAQETRSIRLRWLGRSILQMNNRPDTAAAWTREIPELVSARPWAYREAPDLVVFGLAALAEGADPKLVLDRVFDAARRADPRAREVPLAIGTLALDKGDFALAAKTFQAALETRPQDPDLHFGLARAYEPSEPALMAASLEAALRLNPRHLPSLLLLAERAIAAEDYPNALALLDQVRSVNPWHPEAWACAAVLAHLQNQPAREEAARDMALRHWPANPRVPYLMGRQLSRAYRFAEGAALQRQALAFDRHYLPAKAQLALDLLRLGEDAEGWQLAEHVHELDGYDVTALNLVTLRDTLGRFTVLTNQHFVLRLPPHEAPLYGPRALELLEEARTRLTAKYGLELARPVHVEIFAEQKDFAVRTFGLPQNHGFLGVCFGHVITANSPGSRPGLAFNWESMLWHEFTHVITLQLTRNRMPRWLSEGLSVYEERQANPAWGEQLTPRYREMILEGDLTPVSQLSRAFQSPPSPLHLQFAYYQSSLVVEFFLERFGLPALRALLADLGQGLSLPQALEQHLAPLPEIDLAFAAFARQIAQNLAPGLDWEKPELEALLRDDASPAWELWAQSRPDNYHVLTRQARRALEAQRWTEAQPPLERLLSLYPNATGPDSPYRSLARVHRELGNRTAERDTLARWAAHDSQATDACLRLMELAAEARDWPAVATNALRYLAVNPLVPPPYRYLAQSAEHTRDRPAALRAYRALLALDPPNPAEIHYQLARQLHEAGDPAAQRHLLEALEAAPRHRPALRLLLERTPPPAAP